MAEQPSTELAIAEPQAPLALFGTTDPALVLERASQVATVLAKVVNDRKLFAVIQGRKFPTVEGWTMLGGMLGVFAHTEWTQPILDEGGRVRGFKARVVARTLSGVEVGSAEAVCMRGESSQWSESAKDYALLSMAQTRATSKAMGNPLRWVFKLAGYEGAASEEMERTAADANGEIAPDKASAATQSALREAERMAVPQSPSAPQVNSAGAVGSTQAAPAPVSSGPRAKRGHVVPAPAAPAAPQGAPSSDQRSQPPGVGSDSPPFPAAIQGPAASAAVTSTPPVALLDPEEDDPGREQYLASLRQQAREAAAVLRQLRVRSENQKHKDAIALGTVVALAVPPATPGPDSDASLAAYIAEKHQGKTLTSLEEPELKAVVDKLEELTALVSAKLQ